MVQNDFKSLSAKVTTTEHKLINDYCKNKGTSPSKLIKRLLLSEIESTDPNYLAGKNIFKYNKSKDNYSWIIELDDDRKIKIEDNLSIEYIQNLKDELDKLIFERKEIIRYKKNSSIAIPKTILKK